MVSSQKARAATVLLERCLYYIDTPGKALKITNVTVFVKLRILFTYDIESMKYLVSVKANPTTVTLCPSDTIAASMAFWGWSNIQMRSMRCMEARHLQALHIFCRERGEYGSC